MSAELYSKLFAIWSVLMLAVVVSLAVALILRRSQRPASPKRTKRRSRRRSQFWPKVGVSIRGVGSAIKRAAVWTWPRLKRFGHWIGKLFVRFDKWLWDRYSVEPRKKAVIARVSQVKEGGEKPNVLGKVIAAVALTQTAGMVPLGFLGGVAVYTSYPNGGLFVIFLATAMIAIALFFLAVSAILLRYLLKK